MSFLDIFSKEASMKRKDSRIDLFDDLVTSFEENPFPGPLQAQWAIQKAGFMTGAEFAGRFTVLGRLHLDLKETVITHSFGNQFQDTPTGQGKLEFCALRYQAMHLALDRLRFTPHRNILQMRAEAQDVVDGIADLFQRHPKLERIALNPYTDCFTSTFTLNDNGFIGMNNEP